MLCGSHIKIWNLANHMNKQNKKHQKARSLVKNWKLRVWCSLFYFFHVICKISNFNMWTPKHLAQASCTELTLKVKIKAYYPNIYTVPVLISQSSLSCLWKNSPLRFASNGCKFHYECHLENPEKERKYFVFMLNIQAKVQIWSLMKNGPSLISHDVFIHSLGVHFNLFLKSDG